MAGESRIQSKPDKGLSLWKEAGWLAAIGAAVGGAALLATHNSHKAAQKPESSSPHTERLTPAAAFLLRAKGPDPHNQLLRILPIVQCDITYDKPTKTWVPYSGKNDHYISPQQPELFGLAAGRTIEFEGAAGMVDAQGYPDMDVGIDTIDATASAHYVHLRMKPDEMTGYKMPKPTDVKIPLHTGKPVMGRYDTVIYDVIKNDQGQIGIAFACNPMIVNRENRRS